jgi:hypothetical protein
MADEEYELLPHKLLADLKDDVEMLRKKLNQPETKINELILEIESMKDSIHELNTVFAKALDNTKEEDPHKAIKIMEQKMETVLTQNETIARGMVAISDKLEDFMGKHSVPQQKPVSSPQQAVPPPKTGTMQHSMGPPSMPGSRTAPVPEMEPQESGIDFPPPPPSAGKKKKLGIF